MEYYIIKVSGAEYTTVYDTQDIISTVCELTNGYGIQEEAIEITTVTK